MLHLMLALTQRHVKCDIHYDDQNKIISLKFERNKIIPFFELRKNLMKTYKCTVCGQPSMLFDVVDFNKSCEEIRGQYLPLLGHGVYYARCTACKYTFAPEFCAWTDQDFLNMIYNDDYVKVDPDYLSIRPKGNADALHNIFGTSCAQINHLDYGGGNGVLSSSLVSRQWSFKSYDPFPENDVALANLGRFNLITAFEVFEHVPNPHAMMETIEKLLSGPDAVIFFSTLISDGCINEGERLNWWYVAPRNGHIGIHSTQSLTVLSEMYGMSFYSLNAGTHIFYKSLPIWAERLISK